MNHMDERHLRKFELLGIQQQQRIMKNLEKSARKRAKGNTVNREEEEGRAANYYHRRKVMLSRQARALNLYRGFLKGLTYEQVENNLRPESLRPRDVVGDYMQWQGSRTKGWQHYEDFLWWCEAGEDY